MDINPSLKKYINEYIFPQYAKNEEAHGIEHIKYVIDRCFELSKNESVNDDMVFTIASYHDIGHHIDSKNHEIVSAHIMFEDKKLKQFFNEKQLLIMKEAIEDHRASLDREPRTFYGKLISSADKNTSVKMALERTYFYGKNHYPDFTDEELMEKSYDYLTRKFGKDGYAYIFIEDEKYSRYLEELQLLLNDKKNFKNEFEKIMREVKKNLS